MMRLLIAEWLKTKRSALRWLIGTLPVVVGGILGWYIVGRPWITAASAFSGFFSVWSAMVVPLGIAICAGQLAAEEAESGFTAMLLCARPRVAIYLAKLIMLAFFVAMATALAVGTFCFVLWLGGHAGDEWALYGRAALACWAAALPLAACHLWLAMARGLGASVGVGIGGALVGALIGDTLLGDGIWPFVPWAWPVRLSVLQAVEPSTLSAPEQLALAQSMNLACLIALISGILVTVSSLWWFSRWDGRHTAE